MSTPDPTDAAPSNGLRSTRQLLAGWGRTAPTAADVVDAPDDPTALAALQRSGARGLLARGLGRGYGDCAQNAGGLIIDGPSNSGLIDIDLDAAVVTARAGTSLDELMRWLVPLGMFVPVTPGTRMVTVGGAIAADIHGKNHHTEGSWCNHLEQIRLIDGNGDIRTISPSKDPEAFWATAGGMGLTGVVLDATIRMKPITSSRLSVDTDRADDLDAVMALMVEGDDDYDYSVAWIDLMARGASMGRSVLDRGRFATREEVLRRGDRRSTRVPHLPAALAAGSGTVRACSTGRPSWRSTSCGSARPHRDAGTRLQSIETFFHPLDMVAEWNRIYGRRGFLQWQFVVPDEAHEVVRTSVERLSGSGISSFLAVLKRMGPADPGPLSFPIKGWTLALDMPVMSGLDALLDELDELVVGAGGRVYLVKDSRVRPELVPVMYPRIDQWRETRDKLDPQGRFRSDMARRLNLC